MNYEQERFLHLRDWELLRTLGRLRYVPTRQLVGTFFGTEQVTRRRLQRLAELGAIKRHVRGLPIGAGYSTWRLSAEGVRLLAEAFPTEPVPKSFEDDLTTGRLGISAVERLEAMNDLYLRFLFSGAAVTHVPSRTAVATRFRQVRDVADAVTWERSQLRYSWAGRDHLIDPDVLVTIPAQRWRVFVYFDPDLRGHSRIRRRLERWRNFLRYGHNERFPDGLLARVLVVVRTAHRAKTFEQVRHRMLLTRVAVDAVTREDAPHALRALATPGSAAAAVAPKPASLRMAAIDIYDMLYKSYQAGWVPSADMLAALARLRAALAEDAPKPVTNQHVVRRDSRRQES